MHGLINLDKPAGLTSARAVERVKRLLPRGTKIGHAGTLDSFATGVLLLLIGRATRSCEQLMDAPKQYQASIKLGATTPTLDPESAEEPVQVEAVPSQEIVAQALARFVGEIEQRPPLYSALKIAGRRASDIARSGAEVKLDPRRISIYAAELVAFAWPIARVRINCGRGTYVRSIARDLGEALGTGGYLTELRRTRTGAYAAEAAVTLERLAQEGIEPHLLAPPEGLMLSK